MASAVTAGTIALGRPIGINLSHASEILRVANMILYRHHDHELGEKMFLLEACLELSRMYPQRDYYGEVHKALADLTATVRFHLSSERNSVACLFWRLS